MLHTVLHQRCFVGICVSKQSGNKSSHGKRSLSRRKQVGWQYIDFLNESQIKYAPTIIECNHDHSDEIPM